ncbi:hypothetical protein QBC39DRAFT_399865 [Podospora conica]|nr:hypothetical protein QBC39DRAFT_399865 [Schizothecium conicum]
MTNDISPPAAASSAPFHRVDFTFILPLPATRSALCSLPPYVRVVIHCSDLPTFMRDGLRWTTRNIVSGGYLFEQNPQDERFQFSRRWLMREHPGKPEAESRWRGDAVLYTHDIKFLGEFRFHQLKRTDICAVRIQTSTSVNVGLFEQRCPELDINFIDDSERFDLWWVLPNEGMGSKRKSSSRRRYVSMKKLAWAIAMVAGIYALRSTIRHSASKLLGVCS